MPHLKSFSETMATLRENLSATGRMLYDDLVKHLADSDTASGALKTGDPFPEFALLDENGNFVASDTLFAKAPLAINFYREPLLRVLIGKAGAPVAYLAVSADCVVDDAPPSVPLNTDATAGPSSGMTTLCCSAQGFHRPEGTER